ncbi:type II toxin-antitoxin system RelB/DinJ family antitoxin [Chlorobium limicola]|jgi:DNA-damage-inducible protein J|uniref:XRE family transcriptional regulator n=1 Tax=Chlorobium limicola TaxID=1092 RepID=A0A101JUA0_CHLLI|nr:type II toxin-antitoxin system RelB/DinJ family antitoxin [Chlorobium limicola]KUL32838.1 XRE family transcriptional regulator [Chlorobium limicola]
MIINSVVRARIDQDTKDEAAVILAAMGLTMSDAVRLLMKKIVAEKAFPFNPLIPNNETIQAIKEARAGNTRTIGSVDELFKELNEDD